MAEFAQSLNLLPEQLGMKAGMLVGMLFPLAGIFVFYRIKKKSEKIHKAEMNND